MNSLRTIRNSLSRLALITGIGLITSFNSGCTHLYKIDEKGRKVPLADTGICLIPKDYRKGVLKRENYCDYDTAKARMDAGEQSQIFDGLPINSQFSKYFTILPDKTFMTSGSIDSIIECAKRKGYECTVIQGKPGEGAQYLFNKIGERKK